MENKTELDRADIEIRVVGTPDASRVASLLGDCFQDDPGIRYMLRTPQARARWLDAFFRATAEVALSGGLVLGVWARPAGSNQDRPDDLAGVALWYPENRRFPPPWYRTILPGLRVLPLVLEPSVQSRYTWLRRFYLRLMPKGRRYWYLAALAVRLDYRHQGIGTTLVRDGMSRASREESPVFLHSWPTLLSFYRRLGFSPVVEGSLKGIPDVCVGLLFRPDPEEPQEGGPALAAW